MLKEADDVPFSYKFYKKANITRVIEKKMEISLIYFFLSFSPFKKPKKNQILKDDNDRPSTVEEPQRKIFKSFDGNMNTRLQQVT